MLVLSNLQPFLAKNLINFLLRLQQNKRRIYETIALFTQLCEICNKWVFMATNRFCLNRLIYTPTRHLWEQYTIYTDAWKQKNFHVENNTIFTQMLENKRTFVSRTVQYLHRCLKIKKPLFREHYNIYIDAWKQKNLYVENNTIFTQMLKNKDLCVENNTIFT